MIFIIFNQSLHYNKLSTRFTLILILFRYKWPDFRNRKILSQLLVINQSVQSLSVLTLSPTQIPIPFTYITAWMPLQCAKTWFNPRGFFRKNVTTALMNT